MHRATAESKALQDGSIGLPEVEKASTTSSPGRRIEEERHGLHCDEVATERQDVNPSTSE